MPVPTAVNTDSQQLAKFGPPAVQERKAENLLQVLLIGRALQGQRERCGPRRQRPGSVSSIRRPVPERTFSDWRDPPPGFVEADLVAHSGAVTSESFVQTLVVTEIGLTVFAPLLVREQTLLVDEIGEIRRRLPFPLLSFNADNDSVFISTRGRISFILL
jgi:hypothetical protein